MSDPEARKVIEMGYGGSERLTKLGKELTTVR